MIHSRPVLQTRGILAAILIVVASPVYAHAYGDPGSGALLWQLLIAGMFGFMFYIRQTIRKVREWFGPKQPPPSTPEE